MPQRPLWRGRSARGRSRRQPHQRSHKTIPRCHCRLKALRRGLPTFVHALGMKPWKSSGGGLSASYLSTTPYTYIASQYQSDLCGNVTWVKSRDPMSRLLRALGFGHPALSGMPIAVGIDLAFPIGMRLKRMIRRLSPWLAVRVWL